MSHESGLYREGPVVLVSTPGTGLRILSPAVSFDCSLGSDLTVSVHVTLSLFVQGFPSSLHPTVVSSGEGPTCLVREYRVYTRWTSPWDFGQVGGPR